MNSRPTVHPFLSIALPLSCLLTLPGLIQGGLNIVTRTYQLASVRFWEGLSLYPPPISGTDYFKYSPLFAFLYSPIASLEGHWQAAVWAGLNATIYWWGLSLWIPKNSRASLLLIGGLLASMELDGSLRYQQTNAALCGGILIFLNLARQGEWFVVGFGLSVLTNLKLFPASIALPLLARERKEYPLGLLAGALVAFFLPVLFSGWSTNWNWYLEWFALILGDIRSEGLMDLASVWNRVGAPMLGNGLRFGVLLVGLWVLFTRTRIDSLYVSAGLLVPLLCSPRTESPTFVLAGPVFPLLLFSIAERSRNRVNRRALGVS